MIEFSTVESLIMTYAPMVVTIFGIVISFLKMISVIKEIKNDNKKSNEEKSQEILDLKNQMQSVINQNYELKKRLNQVLTYFDHIKRSDNDETNTTN